MESTAKEFADMQVSPASDINSVQFFRFRKPGVGKLVEYIELMHRDGRRILLFDVVSKNQFVSRLGLKISEVRDIFNYRERNQTLQEALKNREEPLLLRTVKADGFWNCYAVVTEKFTEIKHVELYKMVDEELNRMAINVVETKEFRTTQRVWKTYIFEKRAVNKVGEVIQAGLRVANSVKGTSSVIFYPYWMRLVCENGMTSSQGHWKQATTHKGLKADILQSVKTTLQDALDEAFGIEKLIEQAVAVKISDTEAETLLRAVAYRKNLSQYATRLIFQRMRTDKGNLWNFVNAITYVSSHNQDKMSPATVLSMEQVAHGLLRNGKKGMDEYLAQEVSG